MHVCKCVCIIHTHLGVGLDVLQEVQEETHGLVWPPDLGARGLAHLALLCHDCKEGHTAEVEAEAGREIHKKHSQTNGCGLKQMQQVSLLHSKQHNTTQQEQPVCCNYLGVTAAATSVAQERHSLLALEDVLQEATSSGQVHALDGSTHLTCLLVVGTQVCATGLRGLGGVLSLATVLRHDERQVQSRATGGLWGRCREWGQATAHSRQTTADRHTCIHTSSPHRHKK